MNKKGFSVLELILVLIISMAVSVLTISNGKSLNMEHYYFMNDYLLKQSDSMRSCSHSSIDKNVGFNSMGRTSNAQTINFPKRKVIVHLGNGYITCE